MGNTNHFSCLRSSLNYLLIYVYIWHMLSEGWGATAAPFSNRNTILSGFPRKCCYKIGHLSPKGWGCWHGARFLLGAAKPWIPQRSFGLAMFKPARPGVCGLESKLSVNSATNHHHKSHFCHRSGSNCFQQLPGGEKLFFFLFVKKIKLVQWAW